MTPVFLSHPVSGDVAGNLRRAKQWLRWLIEREPNCAFLAGWIVYCEALDDSSPTERARGLRDSCAVAAMCGQAGGGIVLCGARVTDGMRRELDACDQARGWVADLTDWTWPDGSPTPDRSEPPFCGTSLTPDGLANEGWGVNFLRRWTEHIGQPVDVGPIGIGCERFMRRGFA